MFSHRLHRFALMVELNELIYRIRGIIFKVHSVLGLGLLESVYEAALVYEFIQSGLAIETQKDKPVIYNTVKLNVGFRLDIIVEDTVILEVKSVEALRDVHKKQLLNYLKLTGKK